MPRPTLIELSEMLDTFNAAVMDRMETEPAWQQQLESVRTKEEATEIDMLVRSFNMSALQAAISPDPQAAKEGLARDAIALYNTAYGPTVRALGEDTLIALIDPAHKTAQTRQTFEDLGAPVLARLYAPKP